LSRFAAIDYSTDDIIIIIIIIFIMADERLTAEQTIGIRIQSALEG